MTKTLQRKWLPPFAGLLLAGACQTAFAGTATVYYYTPYKNWTSIFVHHNGGGSWTAVPGERMDAACAGWVSRTVTLSGSAQAVFTNGNGAWDNPGGQSGSNYTVPEGVHQVRSGQLLANAGSPCGGGGDNSATVFYKPNAAWSAVNIHYSPSGGSWTTPPGVAMDAACTGWRKKTIALGAATGLSATFNNGSGTWDNNGGRNYTLGTGNVIVDAGAIRSGDPCAGSGSQPPSVPTGLRTGTIGTDSIALSWTASSDDGSVVGYEVYRGDQRVGTPSGTSFTDTGLAAGTSYTYTIKAKDNEGLFSAASAPLSARTQDPVAVNRAEVYYYTRTRGWTRVNIHYMPTGGSWTTPPGVAMESGCTDWFKKTIDLGSATGLKAAFNNGSVWDNNGGADFSLGKGVVLVRDGSVTNAAQSPCTPDTTAPTPPTGLSGRADGTTVTLDWTASTDDSNTVSYVITRSGGSAGTREFTAATNAFTDVDTAEFTTYTYRVLARDPANNRSTDTAVNVTTGARPIVSAPAFSWDNATVYFLLTDRFKNADTGNDRSYGRESDRNGTPFGNDLNRLPSVFHGGDLKGLTQKINEGYFNDLGVNAIWFTAPYEQIHGFIEGEGHKHYAYHGYYPLDYTAIDKNMGVKDDLKAMVDAAHAKGLRVVMDVVLNHAGYETLKDMSEFGFGGLNAGWENTAFRSSDTLTYNNDILPYLNKGDSRWNQWWGGEWLRVSNSLNGYSACSGTDGLLGCVGYLPDFRTDNGATVGLPPLLVNKWTREGRLDAEKASLDAWFARTGRPRIVPNYVVKWLTDYVREYGIDGFRADTVKHVEAEHWKTLKDEAVRARQDWIAANPAKAAQLKGDTSFWMTGEYWDHGANRSLYFDYGFDSMINFSFKTAAEASGSGIDGTYAQLAGVNADNSRPYNLLSYLSSHDKGLFNRGNLRNGLTNLLLAPGGVQIFYGDESGRGEEGGWQGDHKARGDMNWNALDAGLLAHAKKLGTFRNAHVAVGAGSHRKIADSPYTFARVKDGDTVVVATGAFGTVQIDVGGAFAEGTRLRDAYTGRTATVTGGRVSLDADGVVLLEEAR